MINLKKMILITTCMFAIAGCGQSGPLHKNTVGKDSNDVIKKESNDDKAGFASKHNAPIFSLKDDKGTIHSLDEYKGKKVYIKMWASWCPICLSGLDELEELADANKDYVILTIVAPNYKNEKSNDEFVSWFHSLDYKNIQVLLDNDGIYMKEIGVRGYPTSVFIDEKGELKKVQPGHLNNNQIDEIMRSLS